MEFRILGSLQVCDGDDEVPVRGTKQRALLGLLLLQPNHPVSEDVLIESLWGDEPSARAADNLHVLVSRLRRILGTDRLLREGTGYLIRIDEGDLDVATFERLRGEGKLREALELWRGDALADFTYETWAQNEIRRLEELRLTTLEERIERDLAAGVDGELVGELQALVAEHPLRETLRRHLIVALYRSERQAEALEAYRDARRMLDEELGLEPSPALRELEGAVLRQDPSLARPRVVPAVAATRRRPAALAAAAAALAAGFGVAIVAIELLDAGEGRRVAAAAMTTTKALAQPLPSTATTRVVVVRERTRPAPQPPQPIPTKRAAPPPVSPTPPPPPPPPPPAPQPPPPAAPSPPAAPKKKQPPPPPPPPPPPAPAAVRVSDDFDDGILDRAAWVRSASTGVTVEERNGRLEVSVAPGAVAEGDYKLISGTYGTHCRYLGDFDARVEFELLEWPAANGIIVQLSAWFRGYNAGVVRQSQNWTEEYGSWLTNRARSSPSNDLRGALRLRRKGDQITTYYRRNGEWYPLQTSTGFVGAPLIGLQAMSKDEWFAHKPVRIAFDNFSLTAATSAC